MHTGTHNMRKIPHQISLRARLQRWSPSDTVIFTLTAVLVGALTGGASLGFICLIDTLERFFTAVRASLSGPMWLLTALIPAAGGLGAGLLIAYVAPEMIYGGVPAVLTAIERHGSRLRGRLVWAKPLATAICIGTGGSAGRVGPIVQIGAALGSQVGQRFRLTDERIRNLVACGAAAGIASTFNAPIAGVIFALEVILGEFTETYFATIVVSAVTASIISRSVLGTEAAFVVPAYAPAQPLEILFYVVLGGLAALVAWLFSLTYYGTKDLTAKLRQLPQPWRPALGGLLVGLLALSVPQVLGTGFDQIEHALGGQLTLPLMALLVLAKLVATDLTLGTGSSGGIFAPNLFLGAMLGGAFGEALHLLLPDAALASSGAYALVGMAAVFSASAHAPMTALLIIFEMSGSYTMILPLMLAAGISTVMARALQRESIYTLELVRQGIHIKREQEMDVLQAVRVDEAMSVHPVMVRETTPLREVAALINETRERGYPVVDDEHAMSGMIVLSDVVQAQERWEDWAEHTVAEACTRAVITAFPDESVSVALQRLGINGLSCLPVVAREHPRLLLGLIHQSDICVAYQQALAQGRRGYRVIEPRQVAIEAPDEVVDLLIPADSPLVGQAIRDVAWPKDCLVVSVHRGSNVILGKGDLVLHSGDRLAIYAKEDSRAVLKGLVQTGRT